MRKFLLMAAALLGSEAASAQDTTSVKEFPKDKLFSFMTTRPDTCMDMRDVIIMKPFTDGTINSDNYKGQYIVINSRSTLQDIIGTGLNFYIESFNNSYTNSHDNMIHENMLLAFNNVVHGSTKHANGRYSSLLGYGCVSRRMTKYQISWEQLIHDIENEAEAIYKIEIF